MEFPLCAVKGGRSRRDVRSIPAIGAVPAGLPREIVPRQQSPMCCGSTQRPLPVYCESLYVCLFVLVCIVCT